MENTVVMCSIILIVFLVIKEILNQKEQSAIKQKLDSLEKTSLSLFSNSKKVGIIGEHYLYNVLSQLGCVELDSVLNEEEYMKLNQIKYGYKKQYILPDGTIPDCVVFINTISGIKKIAIDSKAILNAIDGTTDKLINQMKGLAKKEYTKSFDIHQMILFFPFVGAFDFTKDLEDYKSMIDEFRKRNVVFSSVENIYLTLEIIFDGFSKYELSETSKTKKEILEKCNEIEQYQKLFKHDLKERVNSSDLVSYLGGTIKKEIALYKYFVQYEKDIEDNIEIQSLLKELKEFK